jgi:dihydroorotate dehydrogenase (NAD+) catalytic subunit
VGMWRDPGLERVLREYAPVWSTWKTPVILSVAADHSDVAAALEGVEGIAGLEITFGDDLTAAARTVAAVRAVTLLPLLVKLPLHDRLIAVARSITTTHVPVVACGGIGTVEDARAFLSAGATAVQVGSALLADPFAAVRIADAL